jgi:hypothetical protein
MTEKDKLARAAEIDAAIRQHDETALRRAADDAAAGEKLDRMLTGLHAKLDDCMTKMDAMSNRMDAMEAGNTKNAGATGDGAQKRKEASAEQPTDDELPPQEDREGMREPGAARELVADSQRRHEHAMADAQARADAVAGEWGEQAPPPLSGEKLQAYRCRLLRRYQRFSKEFKLADLDMIRDQSVFDGVERSIYADARLASATPDAAPGQLRQKTRQVGGHTINEFFGSPSVWMDQFAGNRRFVKMIDPKYRRDG